MQDAFIHIQQLTVHYQQKLILQDLNWQINKQQHWVLSGKSGSGKTTLAQAIAGLIPYQGKIDINFEPARKPVAKSLFVSSWYQFTNLEGDRNFYYQQRYNKHQGQDTLTVFAELLHYSKQENLVIEDLQYYLDVFDFNACKDAQLIELSSGEHKKIQLIKALWLQPQLLIIDQPYTGLDKKSRQVLNQELDRIADKGVQLILICNEEQLPTCVQNYAEIKGGQLYVAASRAAISLDEKRVKKTLPYFLQQTPTASAEVLVAMENVQISYGEKQVLKNISWQVKAGEKWLLQGPNGSGKSTLLSLINGDHPQAYANRITLFGKARGTGESIWEIKSHLGIISPEMHWYFDKTAQVWQTVASGFFDSVGLFKNLRYDKQQKINEVLDFFDLTPHKNELLVTLPLGKQRLALLARTIVKNPELLILDEPCQGLDSAQTQHFNAVVDELSAYGKTLIYVGHFETQVPDCIEKRIVLENGKVLIIENIKKA